MIRVSLRGKPAGMVSLMRVKRFHYWFNSEASVLFYRSYAIGASHKQIRKEPVSPELDCKTQLGPWTSPEREGCVPDILCGPLAIVVACQTLSQHRASRLTEELRHRSNELPSDGCHGDSHEQIDTRKRL
jgi:hypothetical protein